MRLILLALVLAGCLCGCTMDDDTDEAGGEAGSIQEGTKEPLTLTVCFEGQPCPGRKGGSNP